MKYSGIWAGIALIGDGVAGMIWPRRYLRFLKAGPSAIRDTFEAFAQRPALTRVACVAEVGIGVWMIAKNL